MGKGTNTTSTSNAPNPQAGAAYSNLIARAGNVANTPYQAYSGELVAPVNAQQQTGIGGINTNANYAQPFINQAAGYANQAAQPITAGQIAQYQNPFQRQVVNATEAQFNQQNAMQQSQLTGNAAAQGALGGDRVGVAQGTLAGQQQLAEAPVIAGLETQGYNTALQTALQEQQQMGNAAYSLGNLGVAGQNAALTGANAQIGAGTLEQQTQQAQNQAAYGQFAQGQAFPYQQTQWLAGLDTGVGSQMGGTGTTTGPAPNPWAQFAGLGLAGASLFGNQGGRIEPKGLDSGGSVGFGGTPYGFETSYIPTMQISPGKGPPTPPGLPGSGQQPTVGQTFKDAQALGGLFKNKGLGSSFGGINYGLGDWGGGASGSDMASAASAGVDSGLSFDPSSGSVFRRGGGVRRPMVAGFGTGGMVRHYAGGGGDDSFDDRFGDFRPMPQRLNEEVGQPVDLASPSRGYPAHDPGMFWPNSASLTDIDPATRTTNTFGFDYNPVRTDANRAYGPDPSDSDLPPIATTPAAAPPLAPGRNIDDIRTAGLGASPGGDDGAGYSGGPLGFAGAPELAPRGTGASAGSRGGLGLLSKLGIDMSPNLRQGLLAAGLGMMASHSPFLGTAVGEGGLQGLAAYSGAEKQEEAKKKTEADIEHGRNQLDQAAKIAQARITMETKKLSEQAEDRKENRALRLQLSGYKPVEEGLDIIKGGPKDPEVIRRQAEAKKAATADSSFDDNTLTKMADQYLAGDKGVLVNLGRGAQGATDLKALRRRIVERMDEAGVTPQQQAVKMQEFAGLGAGERALGTRTAQIEMAANEALNMMPVALAASAAVPRTDWTPINRAIQTGNTSILSDPKQAQFVAATFSLVNGYVRAIAPTGVPPESAREHALQMLSTAMSHESYKAVTDTMKLEMQAALRSPGQVMDKFRELHGGAGSPAGGGAAPAAAPTGGGAHPQAQQALEWANANPNDPRAAAIKQRLGVQ